MLRCSMRLTGYSAESDRNRRGVAEKSGRVVGGEEEPILVRGLTQDLRRASSQLRALLASGRGLRAGATAWTGHPSQRQPFGTMIHNRSRVVTFLVQHWMGVEGMPRRIANYPDLPGNVTTLNIISTVGSWILALSILMFLWNVYVTWRFGERVTEDDPWGYCSSLEWATSCPPPSAQLLPHSPDTVPSGPRSTRIIRTSSGAGSHRDRTEDPRYRSARK